MKELQLPALAEQRRQHLPFSNPDKRTELRLKVEKARAELEPAEPKILLAELASCLTLVAPSGMTADDRAEWLKVARMTVGGIPAGPFRSACKKARETCRFASEIVPAIVREAEDSVGWLRLAARYAVEDLERLGQIALPKPEYVTPEQIAEIKAEITARFPTQRL